MMKITSVRFRLTLWNIGVLALVLFGFLLIVHMSVRGYLLSAMDQRLKGIADRSASFFARVEPSERAFPRHEEHGRSESRRERMVRLFDLKGRQINIFGRPAETQEPPWDRAALKQAASGKALFSMIEEEDSFLRVYSCPLVRDKRQVGVAQAAVSFAEVQALLGNLTVTLTILVPVALIIAGLGGLVLTNRALRPVRQIVDAAASLNADDLSQRLPVVGADEFAFLATTINSLLARLEDAFTQLKSLIERERRFTASASHELRTPLTAIKANATLTLRGERMPEQYREALQVIDQAADAMNRLVQDLLLLARSDDEQLALTFEAVDPHNLFSEAVGMMKRDDEHQAEVRVDVADSAGAIRGDPDYLLRLIVNLLENALRHTPEDGNITLEAEGKGDQVVLTITDTGEGIAPEHLPHLGDRFYRIDPARTRESGGTGLGLAICKSIVEAHQGSITIDSAPGRGTRITIALPRA